jgi:hypothetical protein
MFGGVILEIDRRKYIFVSLFFDIFFGIIP